MVGEQYWFLHKSKEHQQLLYAQWRVEGTNWTAAHMVEIFRERQVKDNLIAMLKMGKNRGQ